MNHCSTASVVGLEIHQEHSETVWNTAYSQQLQKNASIWNFEVM